MPIGPWELAILCCIVVVPAMVVVVAVLVLRRRQPPAEAGVHPSPVPSPTGTVQCPVCNTTMPGDVNFCPVCGEPRTRLKQQLRQTSSATGIPYEELLSRAREEQTRPKDGHST
jgi:hypothetical protein